MSDETPKTGEGETTPKTPWWKKPWPIAIVAALLLIGVLAAMANTVVFWSNYSSAQLAAAGGWVGGIGSIAAVSVALIQSSRANKQARAAEERAKNEIELANTRHTENLRQAQASIDAAAASDRYNREHQAVEAINLSVASMLSEVTHYIMIENSHDKFPEEVSLVFLHQTRKTLMDNTNRGAVSTLLALPNIHDSELQELAVVVHEAITAVRTEFDGSDPTIEEINWKNAFAKCTPMNLANRDLQAGALRYFAKKDEPTQTDPPTAK